MEANKDKLFKQALHYFSLDKREGLKVVRRGDDVAEFSNGQTKQTETVSIIVIQEDDGSVLLVAWFCGYIVLNHVFKNIKRMHRVLNLLNYKQALNGGRYLKWYWRMISNINS